MSAPTLTLTAEDVMAFLAFAICLSVIGIFVFDAWRASKRPDLKSDYRDDIGS